MGNESSQLERPDEMPNHHGGRVMGPSMSPTPSDDERLENGRVIGPSMSPLPSDGETEQPAQSSSSKRDAATKKKKKKQKKGVDDDAAEAEDHETTRKSKKKSKRKHLQLQDEEDGVVIKSTPNETETDHVDSQSKRKAKKSKKHPTHGGESSQQNDTAQEDPMANETGGQHKEALERDDISHVDDTSADEMAQPDSKAPASSRPKKGKRQMKQKQEQDTNVQMAALIGMATVGQSPPSAQQPTINGLAKSQPTVEADEDEAPILWRNQPTRGFKTEPPGSEDEDLPFQLSGVSNAATSFADATRDPTASTTQDREGSLGWLQSREARELTDTPVLNNISRPQKDLDATLPVLRPSQIKSERQPNDDGSNSASSSPTAARLVRQSRSRSRSMSRAGSRAEHDLGPLVTAQNAARSPSRALEFAVKPPYGTEPSSPGSNTSIPARTQPEATAADEIPARSASASPVRVKGEAVAGAGGDFMNIDEPVAALNAATAKRQAKKAAIGRKKAAQPVASENAEAANDDNGPIVEEADEPTNSMPSESAADGLSNKNTHIMANLLSQNGTMEHQTPAKTPPVVEDGDHVGGSARQPLRSSQRRKAKPSLAPDLPDPAPVAEAEPEAPVLDAVTQQPEPKSPVKKVGKRVIRPLLSQPGPQFEQDDTRAEQEVDAEPVVTEAKAGRRTTRATRSQPAPPIEQDDTQAGQAVDADTGVTEAAGRVNGAEPEQSASQVQQKPKTVGRKKRTIQSVIADANNANEDSPSQVADASVTENAEPSQPASQPQSKRNPGGKKRRTLQPKASLSLSQIEGEDDGVNGQSRRPAVRRKSAAKTVSRASSDEPEQSQAGPSQEPGSAQKQRKVKRKRRSENNASEDEIETLLAAGPKGRKKKNKKLNSSDDEDARVAKRKRLSAGEGKAKGPWTEEELRALGRVVADFRDSNDMAEEDFNKMVHAVPDKTEPLNQDFWNRADLAVSRRTRKQIVERTRRIYNNYVARGTWTDEQKEEVHELFETHPEKWAEIAGIINRDQKDVRDYWRNHYLVHQTQIKSRWSQEEEDRLKEVIEEFLSKIRIERENNEQFRGKVNKAGLDDESFLDWQKISAAMDHTRSRQQCKWKWNDLREKGLVGHDGDTLPLLPSSPGGDRNGGISERLANAREDYRGMSDEDKLRLVEALHDSQAPKDGQIRWLTLVDDQFRKKWHRPSLKLIWYRLRQTVPEFDTQNVEDNARWLINYYQQHRTFPVLQDNQVDTQAEERVINWTRGSRIWVKPSDDPRATRERQRRSSSASSHRSTASMIEDSDGNEAGPSSRRKSVELGEDDEDEDESKRGRRRRTARDEVPVRIPKHLNGDAARKALAEARRKANARRKGKAPALSAEVAIDSDAE